MKTLFSKTKKLFPLVTASRTELPDLFLRILAPLFLIYTA